MSPAILFIDTNIFLHYQSLEQIDWLNLTGAPSVLILVPPIILRELNKQKDTNASHRLRKRAQAVLSSFGKTFESGPRANLRPGVEAECVNREPMIDFAAYGLLRDLQDDSLLASILEYSEKNPGATPRLVTADVGLSLKARARGIPLVPLPDSLKLPQEEDTSEKRIRQLEAEIRELKHRVPSLTLCFENGEPVKKFSLAKPVEPVPAEIERRLADLRVLHPKLCLAAMEQQPPQKYAIAATKVTLLGKMLARLGIDQNQKNHESPTFKALVEQAAPFRLISQEKIDLYNTELDQFFTNYQSYLQTLPQHENAKLLTMPLKIFILNEGTTPAEDLDVRLHFPDGFQLFDWQFVPRIPAPPEPPRKPRTREQELRENFPNFGSLRPEIQSLPNVGSIGPPPNVSSPTIRQSRSYDVTLRVEKVKHGFRESFDPLYVRFESFEKASSFQIDYVIHAGNVPKPTEGTLSVVVDHS